MDHWSIDSEGRTVARAHLLQQPPLLYDVRNGLLLNALRLVDVFESVQLLRLLMLNDADLTPVGSQSRCQRGMRA